MKPLTSVITLLVAVLVITGCEPPGGRRDAGAPQASPAGRDVQGVTLAKLDGSGDITLASLRGDEVLLYFTAPWTGPGEAAPELIGQLQASGIRVLPVVVDRSEGMADRPDQALADRGACFGHDALYDAVGGIRALPTAVLLGPDGVVRTNIPGYRSADAIIEALAGP